MGRVKRIGLMTAMVVVTLNLWTGAPLLGLWAGSRVAGSSGISLGAVAIVVATMAAACLALIALLGAITSAYRGTTGQGAAVRRRSPWLRSVSGERPHGPESGEPALDALDYALVSVVVLAIAAFEVWFLFYGGSSLPIGT
jgi:hypothetical protein